MIMICRIEPGDEGYWVRGGTLAACRTIAEAVAVAEKMAPREELGVVIWDRQRRLLDWGDGVLTDEHSSRRPRVMQWGVLSGCACQRRGGQPIYVDPDVSDGRCRRCGEYLTY